MAKNKDQIISIKDTLYLDPIEKYKYYGRFPWKLILHILILIGTSAQAILILGTITQYTRAQERIFYDNFVSEVDKNSLELNRIAYLFTIDELRDSIHRSIDNFYAFETKSFEKIEYVSNKPSVQMDIEYLTRLEREHTERNKVQFQYFLNDTYFGPFEMNDKDLKSYMQKIINFKLVYQLKTYIPYSNINTLECYKWTIIQNYSFDKRAHFLLSLDINRYSCGEVNNNTSIVKIFINKLLWIHLVVIALSCASFVLTWKYIYKMAKMYWKIKNKLKHIPADDNTDKVCDNNDELQKLHSQEKQKNKSKWDLLKSSEKGKLFNKWSIVCLIGNILQIFGTTLTLINLSETTSTSEVSIGFGCMFAYINIGRYLDYNNDYSTIYATISRALPNVLRYLLGVLPIFFGFIFFGLCLFWRSERFVSTSSTMMTLFAVLNGDSVFDVFNDVASVSFFLGQIYCYCFCIVFIV